MACAGPVPVSTRMRGPAPAMYQAGAGTIDGTGTKPPGRRGSRPSAKMPTPRGLAIQPVLSRWMTISRARELTPSLPEDMVQPSGRATVDIERGPGHVGGVVGRQERDGRGDVLWAPDPPERLH